MNLAMGHSSVSAVIKPCVFCKQPPASWAFIFFIEKTFEIDVQQVCSSNSFLSGNALSFVYEKPCSVNLVNFWFISLALPAKSRVAIPLCSIWGH